MTRHRPTTPRLVSIGSIVPRLHYGTFSCEWWLIKTNNENVEELYPIRIDMSIITELNGIQFYLKVVEGNKNNTHLPGYFCQANGLSSEIEETTSAALTNLYQKIFLTKTKFSGPREFGLNNQLILENLLEGVYFRPFFIYLDKFQIFVYNIERSNQDGCKGAGCGFMSSFRIKGKNKVLYEQEIAENYCIVRIFEESYETQVFEGKTPSEVWSEVGLFPTYDGESLFGLMDSKTQQIIKSKFRPICQPKNWIEESNLAPLYLRYLRPHTCANIQWYKLFFDWNKQESDIIELKSALKNIYMSNYVLKSRELHAWRTLLKMAGYFNVTPYLFDDQLVMYNFSIFQLRYIIIFSKFYNEKL